MHAYSVFGLVVASATPLEGLRSASPNATVDVLVEFDT
jgi:hypothetical protein